MGRLVNFNRNDKELGPRGAAIIKAREELRLKSYKPTPNDRWTIGWGHTLGVRDGMTCTVEQAEQWFMEDTSKAARVVNALDVELTQGMFDAVVSLVFNAGEAVISATNTIGACLRRRDYFGAWAGFTLWRKQRNLNTGVLENLEGLAVRRTQEMALFLEDGMP